MDGHIILPEVQEHKLVKQLMGASWLDEKIDRATKSLKIRNKLHPGTMGQTFKTIDHPLVYEEFNRIRSQGNKKTFLGTETPIADYLEIDLMALSKTSLPEGLANRLREDDSYESSRYELQIAAGFIRLGFKLTWLDYSTGKHPEFLAQPPTGEIMAVECKHRSSKDGYEEDASNFWKHFQFELHKQMENESLNYWVKLTGREFYLSDHIPLIQQIIATIKGNALGNFQFMGDRYTVHYQKLAEQGNSISTEVVNMYPEGVYGINAGQYNKDQVGIGPLYNPKLIRMELIDDPEHRIAGIKRVVKQAAKQLEDGYINLVYIDVNLPDYNQEQKEMPHMVEAVSSELHDRHKNITAAVISNIYPVLSLDYYIGYRVCTNSVSHPSPTMKIPESCIFPGDVKNTFWIPGKISTLKKQVKLTSEFTRTGRKLYGR
jgi:hypothetical protein